MNPYSRRQPDFKPHAQGLASSVAQSWIFLAKYVFSFCLSRPKAGREITRRALTFSLSNSASDDIGFLALRTGRSHPDHSRWARGKASACALQVLSSIAERRLWRWFEGLADGVGRWR